MTTRSLAALAATSLTLTACGADADGGAGPSAAERGKSHDALLKLARCMREHGVDMPDPRTDEDGGVTFVAPGPGVAQKRAKIPPARFAAAEKACGSYREAIPRPKISEEQQREFREAALAHAKCMREHGVDFPDPEFGEGGEARVQIGPGPGGVNPQGTTFRKADEACRR